MEIKHRSHRKLDENKKTHRKKKRGERIYIDGRNRVMCGKTKKCVKMKMEWINIPKNNSCCQILSVDDIFNEIEFYIIIFFEMWNFHISVRMVLVNKALMENIIKYVCKCWIKPKKIVDPLKIFGYLPRKLCQSWVKLITDPYQSFFCLKNLTKQIVTNGNISVNKHSEEKRTFVHLLYNLNRFMEALQKMYDSFLIALFLSLSLSSNSIPQVFESQNQ